jgi:hypothetical protein
MRRPRTKGDLPVAARTVEVDLPAHTTLDQAIVALLQLRRRQEAPGDATLRQAAALHFDYTIPDQPTPVGRTNPATRNEPTAHDPQHATGRAAWGRPR